MLLPSDPRNNPRSETRSAMTQTLLSAQGGPPVLKKTTHAHAILRGYNNTHIPKIQ